MYIKNYERYSDNWCDTCIHKSLCVHEEDFLELKKKANSLGHDKLRFTLNVN